MIYQRIEESGFVFSAKAQGEWLPFDEWKSTNDIIYYYPLSRLVDNGFASIAAGECHVPFESIYMLDADEQFMLDVPKTYDKAMRLKAEYLYGNIEDKEEFRQKFIQTEEWFVHAATSLIDKDSKSYIEQLDITIWQETKLRNWKMLQQMDGTKYLSPENETCIPFSFVMLAKDEEERNRIRKRLIENALYPAILWNVPNSVCREVKDISRRMLSIHCDARYTESDIRNMRNIISKAISS